VAPVGVTVNSLHPGSVQTNLYSHMMQPVQFVCANIVAPLLFRVRWTYFFLLIFEFAVNLVY